MHKEILAIVMTLGMPIFAWSLDPGLSDEPLSRRADSASTTNCSSAVSFSLPLNDPVDPMKTTGWITPKKQEGNFLCWAAVTEMAVSYYESNVIASQCAQAGQHCCPLTPNSPCDRKGWPEFGELSFHFLRGKITEESELGHYLCQKRSPVLYTYSIVGGEIQHHIYLLYGYTKVSSGTIVFAIDPGDPVGGYDSDVALPFDPWLKSTRDFVSDGWPFGRPDKRDYMDICPERATLNGSCS